MEDLDYQIEEKRTEFLSWHNLAFFWAGIALTIAVLGFAYFMNGDYEKSEAVFRKRLEKFPVNNELNYVFFAANLATLGRTEDAARQAEMVLKLNPEFNLSGWRWINTYKSPEDRQRLYEAAKRAGIPEYPRARKPASLPGNHDQMEHSDK